MDAMNGKKTCLQDSTHVSIFGGKWGGHCDGCNGQGNLGQAVSGILESLPELREDEAIRPTRDRPPTFPSPPSEQSFHHIVLSLHGAPRHFTRKVTTALSLEAVLSSTWPISSPEFSDPSQLIIWPALIRRRRKHGDKGGVQESWSHPFRSTITLQEQ